VSTNILQDVRVYNLNIVVACGSNVTLPISNGAFFLLEVLGGAPLLIYVAHERSEASGDELTVGLGVTRDARKVGGSEHLRYLGVGKKRTFKATAAVPNRQNFFLLRLRVASFPALLVLLR
jgi:hypothetical protein